MLITYIFVGLVWIGIPTSTGILQDGPPVMFTELADSKEKCELYSSSFEQAETQMNTEPFVLTEECLLITDAFRQKDPM